jgi:hypothetical protein
MINIFYICFRLFTFTINHDSYFSKCRVKQTRFIYKNKFNIFSLLSNNNKKQITTNSNLIIDNKKKNESNIGQVRKTQDFCLVYQQF